jgi:hypothetical protein
VEIIALKVARLKVLLSLLQDIRTMLSKEREIYEFKRQ